LDHEVELGYFFAAQRQDTQLTHDRRLATVRLLRKTDTAGVDDSEKVKKD